MHSHLISLFGLDIQSYGVMLAIGFALCYALACRLARRLGREEPVDSVVMLAAVGGVIGARAVYVWQNWEAEFARHLDRIPMVWQGGLVFYGGFILALALIVIHRRLRSEPLWAATDFYAVFLPLGQAFGRVGCFLHGCCFGGVVQQGNWLGVCFPHGSPAWSHQVAEGALSPYATRSLPVWPTQLMEAAGCVALFVALWLICRKPWGRRPGLCSGLYCLSYGVLRFVVETLRDDPRGARLLGLSFSQCVSLGLLAAGTLFVFYSFWRMRHGTKHC